MSTNYMDYVPDKVECDSNGRIIERVGSVGDKPVGIEILPTDEGGWDVVACVFDDSPHINEWVSIGDAEEVNTFATKEQARIRGLQIIEQELGTTIS